MPLTQPAQWARAQFGHANLSHSVLLSALRERKIVGIAEQRIWPRDVSTRGLCIRYCDWLEWHRRTSEAVTTSEQASKIIGNDELRWLIEDDHKIGQSAGTRVEGLKMQSRENLTRMCVILTFIAARLLPLRCIKKEPSAAGEKCEALLGTQSWKLLWLKMDEEATAG
ncbi:MAG: hypothetical protein ACRC8B_17950 [Aeromonas sobria]|uniref:hypothetical protein n=1 Tax=Aeromonas sobria TaxID=646 RepID=UPI003F3F8C4C